MGTCTYCHQSAGLLSSKHQACEESHQRGLNLAARLALDAFSGKIDPEKFTQRWRGIRDENFVTGNEMGLALGKAFGPAITQCLEDGVLSSEEESRIRGVLSETKIQGPELDAVAWFKFTSACTLRVLLEEGIAATDAQIRYAERLPFDTQEGELLALRCDGVSYLKAKTKRSFIGGSQGVSIRLARGLYYRVGAFKGEPVETTEFPRLDKGTLAVSNQAIYFAGASERFRLPHSKVLSREIKSDGMLFWRDRANAKAEGFQYLDGMGWLLGNVFENLKSA